MLNPRRRNPSAGAARTWLVIGEHMAGYVREHVNIEAAVIHPPDLPHVVVTRGVIANPNGYLLAVNPLPGQRHRNLPRARRSFSTSFPLAALPGWGTTTEDRVELARRANIRVLPNAKHIEDVLAQARLLA